MSNFKKSLFYQKGFSAWTLLPWLLFLTLAFVFWWFVNERHNGVVEPITPAQITPMQQIAEPPQVKSDSLPVTPVLSYHDAVKKASVSVVNIYTTQKIDNPYANDPLFREFLQYHGYQIPENGETNLGSGVIVSADGYIITNAHVIDKADEIVVALNDGRKAKASVIGADIESDLAVVKIELDGLTPLALRTSAVQVGDVTLAIGNPFGVGQTVTQGIVSATGRGLGMNTFENFIQTDASINPGNSGGALVDAQGELIGINTMIYSRSGGSMGIGFAIPTDTVQKVMNDIIKTGKVSRGWLGIEVGQPSQNPASLDDKKGVVVAGINPDAPAQKAGVLVGDVIVAIDGVPVNDAKALIQMVAQKSPNSEITLDVVRADTPTQIKVVLGERPTMGKTAEPTLNEQPNVLPNQKPSTEQPAVAQ